MEVECGCIILGEYFLKNKDYKIHGLKRGFVKDNENQRGFKKSIGKRLAAISKQARERLEMERSENLEKMSTRK